MSKLNVTSSENKSYIAFLSLSENGKISKNNLIISNNKFRLLGNDTNVSIYSHNSLNDYSKNSNVFEFSNNDYVDFYEVKFETKKTNDSNNVVLMLNKGVNVEENSESIVMINSICTKILDSEIITIMNAKFCNIKKSKSIFNFGIDNTVLESSDSIVIGTNINLSKQNKTITIGNNITSNIDGDKILIGNFSYNVDSDISIAISNPNNILYTKKSDDTIHISKNLIIGANLYNDNVNLGYNTSNVVLSENFNCYENAYVYGNIIIGYNNTGKSVIDNLILGANNKSTNIKNFIIMGDSNVIEGVENTQGDNIIIGEANEINGGNNYLIGGTSNKQKDITYGITFGSSNVLNYAFNTLVIGLNNKVCFGNNLIYGGSRNSYSNLFSSVIIGEALTKDKIGDINGANYYILSDENNATVFGDGQLKFGRIKWVSFKELIENCMSYTSQLDKFRFVSYSVDKMYPIDVREDVAFKLDDDGYCKISTFCSKYNTSEDKNYKLINESLIKYFVKNKQVCGVCNNTNVSLCKWFHNSNDGKYYVCVKFKDDGYNKTLYQSYIMESSKCEEISVSDYNNAKGTTINDDYVIHRSVDYKDVPILDAYSNILNVKNFNIFVNKIKLVNANTLTDTTDTVYNNTYIKKILNNMDLFTGDAFAGYLCAMKAGELYSKEPKEIGKNISKFNDNFTTHFYTNEPLSEVLSTSLTNNITVPKIGFHVKNGRYDEENIYYYSDFIRVNEVTFKRDNNGNILRLRNMKKDALNTYIGSGFRFSNKIDKDKGKTFDFYHNEFCFDNIILFDYPSSDIDKTEMCALNYNESSITKWGIFANVIFNGVTPINDLTQYNHNSWNNYVDMYFMGDFTQYGDESFENFYINNPYNKEKKCNLSDISEFYRLKYNIKNKNYKWVKFSHNNGKFFIPFLFVSHNGGLLDGRGVDFLKPKAELFVLIKTLTHYSVPYDMVISFDYNPMTFCTDNSILAHNVFCGTFGPIYKEITTHLDMEFKDYRVNDYGSTTHSRSFVCDNADKKQLEAYFKWKTPYKYSNYIRYDDDNFVPRKRYGEFNPLINITYMLEKL